MMQFWIRIVVWFLLHEPVRISGSSHGSVFQSPVYQVHNEHELESLVTEFRLHERVHYRYNTQPNTHRHILTYTYTTDTAHALCTRVHTSHWYTQAYVHTYTLHIHAITHAHNHTHSNTRTCRYN